MIESELLKISKLNNFSNVYEKNFNLNSDKKIVFQGKMTIPSLEIGKIDIKGMYNIYKNSERYITPIFVLENENKYKIKYNIKKSSGSLEINFPKENLFKNLNFNYSSDKNKNQGKINLLLKKNYHISINHESNETNYYFSHKIYNICKYKYKYSNNINNSKNFLNISFNSNIFKNFFFYFNNIEFDLNKKYLTKNLHGLSLNYNFNQNNNLTFLGGISIKTKENNKINSIIINNNDLNENKNKFAFGFYLKQFLTSNIKIENCFFLYPQNNSILNNKNGYVFSLFYKNLINFKIKIIKNEIKAFLFTKIYNLNISTNINYNFNNYFQSFLKKKEENNLNNILKKNNLKYSICFNFK